ncbi:hypothetical protein PPL_12012 [Heterostelium album PN500]|uniref:Uncharacterized protein n=1 Tax=Heterostelium pallidum (strain ATCC 26659 / Pp 5 / PN500) TaxID=670386 RepID=D3BV40_HETP5|nr:hypothetical protein PPL_12012 [Heterostelium album PN500]EFA74978.1 hypothetical protein PPL_12012 [Heterostelium album PN500]|eukprot:XP_020427112.1 hypothetical protein PPL_12012 [Heterostelium album PN500]
MNITTSIAYSIKDVNSIILANKEAFKDSNTSCIECNSLLIDAGDDIVDVLMGVCLPIYIVQNDTNERYNCN